MVQEALAQLPERERRVIYLRFYLGLTQSEIADEIGVSQVHVSRILRDTLARLGDELDEGELADQLGDNRSEAHTSELQTLMRIHYADFCLKQKKRSTAK